MSVKWNRHLALTSKPFSPVVIGSEYSESSGSVFAKNHVDRGVTDITNTRAILFGGRRPLLFSSHAHGQRMGQLVSLTASVSIPVAKIH